MFLLDDPLNQLELECHPQERQQSQLKLLQESIKRNCNEIQHLEENIPTHLPKAIPNSSVELTLKKDAQGKEVEAPRARKPAKEPKCIKQAPFLTAEEFESVPAYTRGQLTYSRANATAQEINKAVMSKYKIMRQPTKSMTAAVRNLHFRVKDEETKDTKGEFFIVEADIEEFTQLKAGKRFHNFPTILRHCQRVREIRGSRLVRYAIC